MNDFTKYYNTLVVIIIFITLCEFPLAFVCIFNGSFAHDPCDHTSTIGFNTAQYLFVLGFIIGLTAILHVLNLISWLCYPELKWYIFYEGCCSVLFIAINMCWFIIGAIVIFKDNLDCIRARSFTVTFALVVWSISFLIMLWTCCYPLCKVKRTDSDDLD